MFLVAQVELAVFEMRNLDRNLPRGFLGLFLDGVEFLSQLFILGDFLGKVLGRGLVPVKEVDNGALDFRYNPSPNIRIPQLVLGLRLENRRLELDRYGAGDALTNVDAVVVFLVEFVHALEDALAKGALVGPAVAGVLAVDEREVRFAVADRVTERKLEVLGLVIQRFVKGRLAHFAAQEIEQPVPRYETFLVENEREPAVQAGVVPQALPDIVEIEREVFAENLYVGQELEIGPVGFAGFPPLDFLFQTAAYETRFEETAVPERNRPEVRGEGIHGLGAHAVEAHAELEHVVVVLGACIDD